MRTLNLDVPHAIVVIGIQGSGKTFFAERFAETFNAPYIEEAMYDAMARNGDAAKMMMERVLDETLKTQKSIVIETAVSSKTSRNELTAKLKKAGYITMYVWVQVDLDTAMLRTRRNLGIRDSEYKRRLEQFSAPEEHEQALVISGKHTFATQVKAVLKRLTAPRVEKRPPIRAPKPRNPIIVR